MQIGKKSLSLLLVLVMLFTTLVFFNPIEVEAIKTNEYNQQKYYSYPKGTKFISDIKITQGTSDTGGSATKNKRKDAVNSAVSQLSGYTILGAHDIGGDANQQMTGNLSQRTDDVKEWGTFTFLGYKTSENIEDAYATYIRSFHKGEDSFAQEQSSSVNGKNYTFSQISATDLNKGIGGDYIRLYKSNDAALGLPITALDIYNNSSNSSSANASTGYYKTVDKDENGTVSENAELNEGAQEGTDCDDNFVKNTTYIHLYFGDYSVYTDVTSEITALKAQIDRGGALDLEYYQSAIVNLYNTAVSKWNAADTIFKAFDNKYKAAAYSAEEIKTATSELKNAIDALYRVVDYSALTAKRAEAKAYVDNADAYTSTTANALVTAYNNSAMTEKKFNLGSYESEAACITAANAEQLTINNHVATIEAALNALVASVKLDATTNGGSTTTPTFEIAVGKAQTVTFPGASYTATKTGWDFIGWNTDSSAETGVKENITISVGTTVYAIFTPKEYTVTWLDDNGNQIGQTTEKYGTIPTYDGETPTKQGDAQYSYTFSGWFPPLAPVNGDTSYKAQFTPGLNSYTVTWKNDDGTVLKTDTVEYGRTPVYTGETPTKNATAEFSYKHSGWTPAISTVTGDVIYTATYTETRNSYTVTWKNDDGTVLKIDEVPYGTTPSYTGETPTKTADAEFTYTFAGWDPEVVAVTGEATYTATYSTETNTYTVIWKNEDGTVLETDTDVPYGTKPEYNGATPAKAATAEFSYTHSGWTPEVDSVTGDITYTATFSSTVNEYTITWVDGNGETLKTEELPYGATPEYEGDTPTKAATAQYTYTFNNTWSPMIATVTRDATYTAQFTSTVNEYTITWLNGDGSVIKTEELPFGATPNYTGVAPTKASDNQYTYRFSTWSPAITSVTGDATYVPVFTETLRSYTVTWVNHDGTVLATDTVAYGVIPSYDGETPVKAQDTQNTYTFSGWTTEVVAVTGNVTYTAKFDSAPRKYTITWKNEGGAVLATDEVAYGTVPDYNGETPTKEADVQFTYEHSGWTPEVVAVTGDATYTATYEGTLNKYTVTFQFANGNTAEFIRDYGTTVEMIGIPDNTDPRHDDTQHYSYEWPEISTVTGNVTYEEIETKTPHSFGEGVLTRPAEENGVWSDGYYTYTCNVDGDTHEKTEPVKRADYTDYTEALNKLTELLGEDLDAADKAIINSVIADNTLDNNLIESEQAIVDTATENLKVTFDEMSEHLIKFTVTFIVNGEAVKTETVVNGKNATAPADPAGYYDDNYHYTFTGWDNAFTNVKENITVTAEFSSATHNFTIHTDKDDTYHTDECECGYTKDAEHSYDNGEITTLPTCCDEGEKTFTCSLCFGTKTEPVDIDPNAHKEAEEYIQTVAPTCSDKGKATYNCVYCNEVLRTIELDIIEDAHKAEEAFTVIRKATCFADGYKAILCEYCDEELETEDIAKREHNLVDTTVAQAATCIAKGIMNQKCDCVETAEYEACTFTTTREIEINPENHATDATYVDGYRAPTCTVPGATGATKHECCHEVITESTVIPVDENAHTGTHTNVVGKVDATCYKEGYTGDTYWTCCNALYEMGEVTEKTAHTEGEAVIENKIHATATEDGSYEEVVYCTVCREEISREKKTYSAQDVLPGLPENGKVVIDIGEDGNSTESLDEILNTDAEYKSDDVIVDEDGNITATEDGEAVITVTTPDGEEIDITVTVRTVKTITFVMKNETVTVKAYKGDRLTAPTVIDFTEDGFTYTFKSWSTAIAVVTGDATYTAIYTEPCDYDEFDRLSGLFDEIVNGGFVDAAVLESNKEIIDELTADIEAINAVRGTRDKSEQAIIDAVVERLDELVIRLYPDAGSTLEIFGSATYYVGTVMDLRVMKMPLGTVVPDVEWTSSDENVVFFADGKLFAFGTGTATLTATKGLVTATKTVTVVAGGNTRSVNFTSVDLTATFLIEGYKALYDSTLLYWSDDTALRFRVNVYMNPLFRDYIVYADGVEIEMDENSYYTIPAGSGDVQIVIAGVLYEEEGDEDKEPVTKWSLWDWILDFFRKIGDFFRNLFS